MSKHPSKHFAAVIDAYAIMHEKFMNPLLESD